MPEYRQDPLTGRTVLVAEERADRPHQFDIETAASSGMACGRARCDCPFCEGNESLTPNEIDAFRPTGSAPDSPGWTVRSVPNKFPAVSRRDTEFPDWRTFQDRFETPPPVDRLFHRLEAEDLRPIPGIGSHEVIVDSPRHVLSVTDMTPSEVVNMFRMYARRLASLRREGRWSFVQIFKNVGVAAGASMPHTHSQLVAMPFVPPSFLRTLQNAARYAGQTDRNACFWCDMLRFELRRQDRIVEETEHFAALCPYVSRFTAEVEIHPKEHRQSLEESDERELWELARLVRKTVVRLEQVVHWMTGRLSYNFVLHIEPFVTPDTGIGPQGRPVFHWHLSILPSLARAAGFEWGTGLHINPVSPEKAAKQLRSVKMAEE